MSTTVYQQHLMEKEGGGGGGEAVEEKLSNGRWPSGDVEKSVEGGARHLHLNLTFFFPDHFSHQRNASISAPSSLSSSLSPLSPLPSFTIIISSIIFKGISGLVIK